MCQPQSRGGKRCAAHTRPKFEAAPFGTPEWDDAATEYARTKQGCERLTAMVLTAVAERDWDRAAASESALARAGRANAVQEELDRQRHEAIRAVLLSYDPDELRRASTSSDPEIRAAAAENLDTPEPVLLTLAADTSTDVRCALASRPKAPDAVFEHLMNDESPEVQRALQRFGDRPHSVLSRWSESSEAGDRTVAAYAAGWRGHTDILERLADDSHSDVRNAVAAGRGTPAHVLRQLARDDDARVAGQAMGNDALPLADLEDVIASQGRKVAEAGQARWGVSGGVEARLRRARRFDLMPHIR